jgi:MYXO-CTERM domain-containing protein
VARRACQPLLAALTLLLALLLAPRIAAAGTVTCVTPQPEEQDGRWTLTFNFDYGRVPDMPHIPMMFSFQHVTQYEWSLTDESPTKPVFTRKPLSNQPEINISTDVGFADAAGKIWRSTKNYKIEVRRDAEFEAGEYTLTIRQDGRVFGRPIRITLRGQNEPVDRRAINIEAPRPPKKNKGKTDEGKKGEGEGSETDEPVDEPSSAAEEPPLDEPEGPPAEKPKQGGCGCSLPGASRVGGWTGLLAALGVGAAAGRRTRRSRR